MSDDDDMAEMEEDGTQMQTELRITFPLKGMFIDTDQEREYDDPVIQQLRWKVTVYAAGTQGSSVQGFRRITVKPITNDVLNIELLQAAYGGRPFDHDYPNFNGWRGYVEEGTASIEGRIFVLRFRAAQ